MKQIQKFIIRTRQKVRTRPTAPPEPVGRLLWPVERESTVTPRAAPLPRRGQISSLRRARSDSTRRSEKVGPRHLPGPEREAHGDVQVPDVVVTTWSRGQSPEHVGRRRRTLGSETSRGPTAAPQQYGRRDQCHSTRPQSGMSPSSAIMLPARRPWPKPCWRRPAPSLAEDRWKEARPRVTSSPKRSPDSCPSRPPWPRSP